VLELAAGGEVFDRIVSRGPLSEASAALVVRQVSLALEHLRSRRVVHRDIKPENLLYVSQHEDAGIKVGGKPCLQGGRSSCDGCAGSSPPVPASAEELPLCTGGCVPFHKWEAPPAPHQQRHRCAHAPAPGRSSTLLRPWLWRLGSGATQSAEITAVSICASSGRRATFIKRGACLPLADVSAS
jgi:serine/threonine protein kinase